MTHRARCVVASPGLDGWPPGGRGAYAALPSRNQIGSGVDMASALRDLIALALLAGLGCGLALAHDDLFFAAVFGVASAVTIIEAIRRFR